MVLPSVVVKNLIELINNNLNVFPKGTIIKEGSEDLSTGDAPLSILVYADFDDKAEIAAMGIPLDVPVSVYLQCTSGSFATATESFEQALLMAISCIKIICQDNYYDLTNTDGELEPVNIQAQEYPISIIQKSADASTITAAFTYKMGGF